LGKRVLDPDLVLRDVGRRVAELRQDRRLTQEQFAARAEISWKYLQQVEAGGENLTLRTLVKLANLLGTRLTDLVQRPRSRRARPGRPRSSAVDPPTRKKKSG